MNIKFTKLAKQNQDILNDYPINNILSYLTDILGENILIKGLATINHNVFLEVICLDNNMAYFIKMTKILEEHPFISRIEIIVSDENKTHYIRYMYTYTKDNDSSIICKTNEKYRKGNVWITKDLLGVKVEKINDVVLANDLIKENVKVKIR